VRILLDESLPRPLARAFVGHFSNRLSPWSRWSRRSSLFSLLEPKTIVRVGA
jgi:hypothetical protein